MDSRVLSIHPAAGGAIATGGRTLAAVASVSRSSTIHSQSTRARYRGSCRRRDTTPPAPKSNSANKSVTYGWSGRADSNCRPPAPKADSSSRQKGPVFKQFCFKADGVKLLQLVEPCRQGRTGSRTLSDFEYRTACSATRDLIDLIGEEKVDVADLLLRGCVGDK